MVSGGLAFYMYEEEALDHSALLECLPGWHFDDQAAEVAVIQQLVTHPARVLEPSNASIFVLPIFPYVSYVADNCGGTNHEGRMMRAAAALQRSPWYQRNWGADHLLITNTFRLNALKSLRSVLSRATVAWFESTTAPRRGPAKLSAAAFWRCTVVIPYLATPFCHQQLVTRPAHTCTTFPGRERNSLFFQGDFTLNSAVRRLVPSLRSIPGARIVGVPRGGPWNSTSQGETCVRTTSPVCASKLEFARRMLCSDICLVPKGDTPTSSRFYSAVACGCLPLIVSDDFVYHLPFIRRINYSFVRYVRERNFLADPVGAVQAEMRAMQPHLSKLRMLMRAAVPDLTLEVENSRVADNLLDEYVHQCDLLRNSSQSQQTSGVRHIVHNGRPNNYSHAQLDAHVLKHGYVPLTISQDLGMRHPSIPKPPLPPASGKWWEAGYT